MAKLGALLVAAAALCVLAATWHGVARADTATPTNVSPFTCIVGNGGHVTRPAGSTIVIRQGIAEQTLGILNNFLGAQTTLVSVDDGQMTDVTSRWSAPDTTGQFPVSFVTVPTGVTLASPGDEMRFTFAEVLATKVPEVFNPAAGGQPGQPQPNGPGLSFGGTCTVTAT